MKLLIQSRTPVGSRGRTLFKGGLAVLAGILLLVSFALAQEAKIFEPEFASVFYYLRPSGEAVELERQTPNLTPEGKKILLMVPGEKSQVRFNVRDEMQFVVRVTEDFDQAAATMQLVRFEPRNGRRELLVKMEDLQKNKIGIKVGVEKYGSSSLKVVPAQRLEPGEYCLSRSTIAQGFCFGVDAARSQ